MGNGNMAENQSGKRKYWITGGILSLIALLSIVFWL
jgi:hypothetical protein